MSSKNPGHHIEKNIYLKKIKKRRRALVTVIKNSISKQKRATITHAVILWTSRTPQKDGLNTQHRGIFLRNSGKTQTIALLIHKKERPKKKAFCSNKLNLKLNTACDFLSTKSRHDFKFEAFFILCMRWCQTLHAMLMIQLSLFWAVWVFSPGLQFFGEVTQYPTNWRFNS